VFVRLWRKMSMEPELTRVCGRLFQSLMVLGKKEYWYASTLVEGCRYRMLLTSSVIAQQTPAFHNFHFYISGKLLTWPHVYSFQCDNTLERGMHLLKEDKSDFRNVKTNDFRHVLISYCINKALFSHNGPWLTKLDRLNMIKLHFCVVVVFNKCQNQIKKFYLPYRWKHRSVKAVKYRPVLTESLKPIKLDKCVAYEVGQLLMIV
jgi:hypothetical protein